MRQEIGAAVIGTGSMGMAHTETLRRVTSPCRRPSRRSRDGHRGIVLCEAILQSLRQSGRFLRNYLA